MLETRDEIFYINGKRITWIVEWDERFTAMGVVYDSMKNFSNKIKAESFAREVGGTLSWMY